VRQDLVRVVIDGATVHSIRPFEYMADASVTRVHPQFSIQSGGSKVTIHICSVI